MTSMRPISIRSLRCLDFIEGVALIISYVTNLFLDFFPQGPSYLRTLGIVPTDVTSPSILVDEDLSVAKLSDFGLARLASTVRFATGRRSGMVRADTDRPADEGDALPAVDVSPCAMSGVQFAEINGSEVSVLDTSVY